jgi:hypothetical protein
MIEATENSIRNLKVILYCFEWLTGLKINFNKSEVFCLWSHTKGKRKNG